MAQADRQLLFGLLALQNNFVDRAQLVSAFSVWVADKSRSLEAILVDQDAISADLAQLLNQLVDQHLARRHLDVQASLQALSSISTVRRELEQLNDSDLGASLANLPPALPSDDPYRTETVGQITSDGRRFEIRRPLGRGGLGVVSIALDCELRREVALKEIRSDRADEEQMRRRFVIEAEITGNLEHPGIVPVYGLGVHSDGRPFYAMRFIKGDNLGVHIKDFHARVKDGREAYDGSELRNLLRRFLDICDAVSYAHSRGVLHRDLKPGNIMLGRFGETLVVDWGLAKTQGVSHQRESSSLDVTLVPTLADSEQTRLGVMIGTPAYAPPEQLRGNLEEINERSDVYGLGAILYELLCNAPPAAGATVEEVCAQVLAGRVVPPKKRVPKVPAALSSICQKAMQVHANARYTSVAELSKDLRAWLDDMPVAAHPENAVSHGARWLRKNKSATVAALLGLTAVALVSSVAAWTTNRLRLAAESARQDAVDERKVAEQQRTLADEQRQRADKYFVQARGAVDRFLVSVSEDPQLALGSLLPVRRKLLESALEYYQQFAQENSSDRELSQLVAEANRRVATIYKALGQHAEALVAADQASAALKTLAQAADSGTATTPLDNVLDFSECELLRASLLRQLGRLAKASDIASRVNRLLQELMSNHAEDRRILSNLADSYDLLGLLAHSRADRRQAESALGESLQLRTRLAADRANTNTVLQLASTRVLSAGQMAEERRFPEARRVYQQALDELEPLRSGDKTLVILAKVAEINHLLATTLAAMGDVPAAETYYQHAIEQREELVAKNSATAFQSDLSKSLSDYSTNLKAAQRLAESLQVAEKSLEISESIARYNSDSVDYQVQFAESLLRYASQVTDAEVALPKLNRAQAILEPLIETDSVRSGAGLMLINIHNTLARIYFRNRDGAQGIAHYRQAREVCSRLVQLHPQDFQYRRALATEDSLLGGSHFDAGNYEAAVEACAQASNGYKILLEERSDDDDTRLQFTNALLNHGRALFKLSRVAESNALIDQVFQELDKIKPATKPAVVIALRDSALQQRTAILLADGKPLDAAQAAIERTTLKPKDPKVALSAAKSIASSAQAIPDTDTEQAPVRRKLIELALAQLGRLQELGFSDPESLKSEPDFQLFTDDATFQAIISEMEKPQ